MPHRNVRHHRSSKTLETRNSTYSLLGINDVRAFYADKFVWQQCPNILEHDPESAFDIQYVKQYWIYNNVSAGAIVLDVGCGSGTLNLLKNKNVHLVGIDLSEKGLEEALAAGYDEAILCDAYDIPYPDASFDHIVSLDVLGHIENETKDHYLAEWVRLLKPKGTMLHGIESGAIDYNNLDEKEKAHLVIDGHVGLESFDQIAARFGRFFEDVTVENCMGPCYAWGDIEKYPITEEQIGKQWRNYLVKFNRDQIRGFNAAMLLMRNLLARDNGLGKSGGFVFVRSANPRKADKGSGIG
jgi:ubiquinone/menaquinone biosynthesis C-methylase UbiE